ncbi:hypothetical protein KI387_004327, partial [Taxus chinensis]
MHQVPVTKEVLHPKFGVGNAEVDNLEALKVDNLDILDENTKVQDSKFLVHVGIKEEEASLADLISVPILLQMQKIFSEKEEIFSGESIMVGKTNFNVDDLDESLGFEEEESKQPHGHSAGDQEDTGDLEEKSEDAYISSDLPAKYEVSEKEQIVAGESMTIGSI